jgi:DNA-directed RNA polymerase specialized sigma24 family protein
MDIPLHPAFEYDDDDCWSMLYTRLKPLVRAWVYDSHIPRWQGEEDATTDDIVSETVERTLKRVNAANKGKAEPVLSIWAIAKQTAFHHFIDLVRKEGREIPFSQFRDTDNPPVATKNRTSMEDAIEEAMDNEQFFNRAVQEIKDFPRKQRDALLVDHAKRTNFEEDPTSLQLAYQEVGIKLQDYCPQRPMNDVERRRHSSLLYHARQRLAHLPSMQAYNFFV